jgi:succinate-acetate transporter protein
VVGLVVCGYIPFAPSPSPAFLSRAGFDSPCSPTRLSSGAARSATSWATSACSVGGRPNGYRYGVVPADVASAQEVFFIAWACLFLFLTIPCLVLPAVYPLAVGLVFVACSLAACAVFEQSPNLFTAAGATALTFAFLAFYAWVHVTLNSVGVTKLPPLGPPILR